MLAAVTSDGNNGEVVDHFTLDHLGTPRLVTDWLGNRTGFHTYWPYGTEASDATQDDFDKKFTGHERDPYDPSSTADDMDYMHARFANPLTARFMSLDPRPGEAAFPQSLNRYSYVLGNPMKLVDPTGQGQVCMQVGGVDYGCTPTPDIPTPFDGGSITVIGSDPGKPGGAVQGNDNPNVTGRKFPPDGLDVKKHKKDVPPTTPPTTPTPTPPSAPRNPWPGDWSDLLKALDELSRELEPQTGCAGVAVGVILPEASSINPWTSGNGGGTAGLSMQFLPNGAEAYSYATPANSPSLGFSPGLSGGMTYAIGSGSFSGVSDSYVLSIGFLSVGVFSSGGWAGLDIEAGASLPGLYHTTQDWVPRGGLGPVSDCVH